MNTKDRARSHIDALPPAISGSGGHNATFRAACSAVGFGLGDTDAMALLREFNQRCQPPWTEKELRHKLEDARKVVRVVRPPRAPSPVRMVWSFKRQLRLGPVPPASRGTPGPDQKNEPIGTTRWRGDPEVSASEDSADQPSNTETLHRNER